MTTTKQQQRIDAAVAAQKAADDLVIAGLQTSLDAAAQQLLADQQTLALAEQVIAELRARVAELEGELDPPPPAPTFLMGSSSDYRESMTSLEANCGQRMAANRYYQMSGDTFLDTKSVGVRQSVYSWYPDIRLLAAHDPGEIARTQHIIDTTPAGHVTAYCPWHEPEDNFTTPEDQAAYREAFIVVSGLVKAANRPELSTIWIMMAYSWTKGSGRDPMAWYPGDAYVDMVGLDCYNEGSLKNPQRWDSPGLELGRPAAGESTAPKGGGYVYDGPIAWAEAHGKRWLICEWGTIQNHNAPTPTWWPADVPTTKAAWLEHGVDWLAAIPSCAGVLLFNSLGRKWAGDGAETWTLDQGAPDTYQAWGRAVAKHSA